MILNNNKNNMNNVKTNPNLLEYRKIGHRSYAKVICQGSHLILWRSRSGQEPFFSYEFPAKTFANLDDFINHVNILELSDAYKALNLYSPYMPLKINTSQVSMVQKAMTRSKTVSRPSRLKFYTSDWARLRTENFPS